MDGIRRRFPDMHVIVTATTRPPRPGEEDGRSYHFLSKREYAHKQRHKELIAGATVHGHQYGAPVSDIAHALEEGRNVLLKVDVQGAAQLRTEVTGATFIFIAPGSLTALGTRLEGRRTESLEERRRRLRDAREEMAQAPLYDYCVINAEGQLEHTIGQVACIITAENLRMRRKPSVVRVR